MLRKCGISQVYLLELLWITIILGCCACFSAFQCKHGRNIVYLEFGNQQFSDMHDRVPETFPAGPATLIGDASHRKTPCTCIFVELRNGRRSHSCVIWLGSRRGCGARDSVGGCAGHGSESYGVRAFEYTGSGEYGLSNCLK